MVLGVGAEWVVRESPKWFISVGRTRRFLILMFIFAISNNSVALYYL